MAIEVPTDTVEVAWAAKSSAKKGSWLVSPVQMPSKPACLDGRGRRTHRLEVEVEADPRIDLHSLLPRLVVMAARHSTIWAPAGANVGSSRPSLGTEGGGSPERYGWTAHHGAKERSGRAR